MSRRRIGRRSFFAIGGVATGALALSQWGCGGGGGSGDDAGMPERSDAPADRVVELDHTLIIGTGFGGSISAHRLTEAGHRVTILERGKRWIITPERDTFTTMGSSDKRAGWLTNRAPIGIHSVIQRYIGMVELWKGENIDITCGAGVGGGSLAYAGMMVRPRKDHFEQIFPAALSYDELVATWYPRVAEVLPMRPITDAVLESPNYLGTRTFMEYADRAGLTVERNLSTIDWDIVEAEVRGELPAEATIGEYLYGLNSGAKGSVDRTYLARAEETGRCEVLTQHQVAAIGMYPDGSFRADVEVIDEVGAVVERVVFHAPRLILAAGSLHSTRLLLEAKHRGSMPDLPAELGTGWGNNGQHIHMLTDLAEDMGEVQGGPPAVVIRDLDNEIAPLTIEHGAARFGCHCLITPSSSMPDGTGRFFWNPETEAVELDWTTALNATSDRAALAAAERLLAGGPGRRTEIPGAGPKPQTFHPLGGVPMGVVTDTFGRVNGHANLYVIDGALVPGATPTSNPAWTIAAIAERALDTILREDLA